MKAMGLVDVCQGKVSQKDVAAGDRVNRQFMAEQSDQLWVEWYNNRRFLEHIPQAEAEQAYDAAIVNGDLAA